MGARQPSSLSNDSEGGKGEDSLLVSVEVGEYVRGSSFSGAVVLHNTGLTTPETLMPLGEFLLFEASTFPSLVALGVRWIRDGCGIGLAENLIEAARVSAGIERCEFEKNLDGYFRGYVPPSPNESRENSTVQASELKEPNSPKRFDTPPVPPSTPIRANKRHIDPFFGKPGAAAEEGIGGNTDADAAITSTEEQSFASQFMWNYEPCGFCKVPPMDEEILAAWIEQPSSAEKVRREIEKIRKVGGLSREGGRRRRASKNGNFSSTGHGAVGNDAVIAAAEAALLSAQSAPYNEKILSFDEDQFSEGSDTLNLVCLEISCPNCGKSFKPMLNFESVCPVAGGEEFVKVDNSEGRVAYMPPEVLHNLWEAITSLHGRVAGGSPEWLALNKPQLYHNLLWWTSRRLDIPKHIQFPLVGVGWKKSVARHRVAYEVDAGGSSAPPQLKLGKSVSNETNSGRSNSLKVGMEPKEIFKEEGINAEEESGRKFLESIEEALTLLRRDQGNLGEAMEVVGRAVQLITAEGMGWGKGKRERRKLTYSCVVQLCAHYEISHLSVVSSLDLLNLLPKLESVLGEEDGGEGKWNDVSVGGRGCAMRSVFGHLY
ncbi:hypothetical protein TrST_g913 [Triparma strigata]|uniref:Uncharacterized protein n=1 Tax=Triparma strigata TaxID=1606541 RepID=A0A9W7C0H3_9STRA|nr:hypothetical protein TrST_g913 [Triparma strigata]